MAEGGITGKGFVKGDKRINRKGRPKTFDALRALAQQIAHEETNIQGVTVVEAILRQWAQSKNPQLQRQFIEVAYGKVPDDLHIQADIRRVINWDDPTDGSN